MLDLKRREFIALIGAGGLLVAVHYRRISEAASAPLAIEIIDLPI
jgi:hypothetical protein